MVLIAVVVTVLQGPLSESARVVEQGFWAIRNLAIRENNGKRLGAAGACQGESIIVFCYLQDVRFLLLTGAVGCFLICLQ